MSDYTRTPNLQLYKPVYDADDGMWGTHINWNADTLDTLLAQDGTAQFLPIAGGAMKGTLLLHADPAQAFEAATKGYADKMLPLAGGTMTGKLFIQPAAPLSTNAFDQVLGIQSTTVGSGTNGPATAQIGLNINHQKVNWNSAPAVGEIDGLYVTCRQGGAGSDLGGVLIDIANTSATGFSAIQEAYVQHLNATGSTALQAIRSQLGTLNPGTPLFTGHTLIADVGNLTAALDIRNTPGQGYWGYVLTNWRDNVQNLTIDDQGNIFTHGNVASNQVLLAQGSVGTTSQGAYLMWNRQGNGASYLLNNKGAGTGGITLGEVDNSGTISGAVTIAGGQLTANALYASASVGSGQNVFLDAAAGVERDIFYRTSGKTRWSILTSGSAESGGNAGSDFAISRYDDTGAYIGWSLAINRATGVVYSYGALAAQASFAAWAATPPASKPVVSGINGGNAALASLLTSLGSYGLITNSTTLGGIDGTVIGGTTPAAGSFTTLAASGKITSSGGGVTFGTQLGASNSDVTKFLQLYYGGGVTTADYGIGVTSGRLNIQAGVGPGSVVLMAQGTDILTAGPTGVSVAATSGIAIGTPTIRSGTGAATGTQPSGSIWIRTDGSAGARMYVSQGAGTWVPIASV